MSKLKGPKIDYHKRGKSIFIDISTLYKCLYYATCDVLIKKDKNLTNL